MKSNNNQMRIPPDVRAAAEEKAAAINQRMNEVTKVKWTDVVRHWIQKGRTA